MLCLFVLLSLLVVLLMSEWDKTGSLLPTFYVVVHCYEVLCDLFRVYLVTIICIYALFCDVFAAVSSCYK